MSQWFSVIIDGYNAFDNRGSGIKAALFSFCNDFCSDLMRNGAIEWARRTKLSEICTGKLMRIPGLRFPPHGASPLVRLAVKLREVLHREDAKRRLSKASQDLTLSRTVLSLRKLVRRTESYPNLTHDDQFFILCTKVKRGTFLFMTENEKFVAFSHPNRRFLYPKNIKRFPNRAIAEDYISQRFARTPFREIYVRLASPRFVSPVS